MKKTERVCVTMDCGLKDQAKSLGLNISGLANIAIKSAILKLEQPKQIIITRPISESFEKVEGEE